MAGNKAGAKKVRATMIKKHGSEAALKAWYQKVGSEGGKAVHHQPRGFAARRDIASAAGKVGGIKHAKDKYGPEWKKDLAQAEEKLKQALAAAKRKHDEGIGRWGY